MNNEIKIIGVCDTNGPAYLVGREGNKNPVFYKFFLGREFKNSQTFAYEKTSIQPEMLELTPDVMQTYCIDLFGVEKINEKGRLVFKLFERP